MLRPLRADDTARDKRFIDSLSADSRHKRFFRYFTSVPPELLAELMKIDYDRTMALVAVIQHDGNEQFIGVARYGVTEREHVADFAVAVLDAWQRRGIATVLISALMSFALEHGFTTVVGDVFPENEAMLELARALRFDIRYDADVDLMHVSRELTA